MEGGESSGRGGRGGGGGGARVQRDAGVVAVHVRVHLAVHANDPVDLAVAVDIDPRVDVPVDLELVSHLFPFRLRLRRSRRRLLRTRAGGVRRAQVSLADGHEGVLRRRRASPRAEATPRMRMRHVLLGRRLLRESQGALPGVQLGELLRRAVQGVRLSGRDVLPAQPLREVGRVVPPGAREGELRTAAPSGALTATRASRSRASRYLRAHAWRASLGIYCPAVTAQPWRRRYGPRPRGVLDSWTPQRTPW